MEDEYVIRVPPELLNENYNKAVMDASKSMLEGKLVDMENEEHRSVGKSFVILLENITLKGNGSIVHGDGGVYQTIQYSALAYYPRMHEIVDGIVMFIQKFGAFIKFGPIFPCFFFPMHRANTIIC